MPTDLNLYSDRALTLGSGCKLAFIKQSTGKIIPVLVLIGINRTGNEGTRVGVTAANGRVGIITSEIDNNNHAVIQFKQQPIYISPTDGPLATDWLTLTYGEDKIVYPRIFINSLKVRNTSDSLVINYQDYNADQTNSRIINYTTLKPYEDYSVLTRSLDEQYIITLNPDVVIEKGSSGSYSGTVEARQAMIKYSISNADTSIYLDALEIAKENSIPKVSYEVKPNIFNSEVCQCIYNQMGNIVRINDEDLKFKNVRGYISGFTLDLDNPDQDTIEVKNYKTKFEDLFSTITAQTEEMKKNSHFIQMATTAFTSTGELSQQVLQSSILKVDLDYAFNNGKLTIDEHNGIWATSDTGVVAYRGGGIFTATEKNSEGNWKWNTGITPQGINASLITTGQLDTNLIRIYSGDNLRFQMNGDGIFAYKSKITDVTISGQHPSGADIPAAESTDGKQYVVFNDDGLALIAKKGAKVLNSAKTAYKTVLDDEDVNSNPTKLRGIQEIKRVQVSWDGFILRNWLNERVFEADPQTGNLHITGRIDATSGSIGAWNIDNNKLWADSAVSSDGTYTTFVAINAGGTSSDKLVRRDGTPYKVDNNDLIVSTKDYAFWAGNANPNTAPFYIKKDGVLKATSGQIGGWNLTSSFLYKNDTLVLAPGGVDGQGVTIPLYEDPDDPQRQTGTKTINLNGTVIWAPGPSSGNAIPDSLSNAKFTLTKNGILTAAQINGCVQDWFRGGTLISVTGSTSVTIKWYRPDGSIASKNFNTANGVKAKITSLTPSLGLNKASIIAKAEACYPNGNTISGSGTTDTLNLNLTASVTNPAQFKGVVHFYINGIQVKTVTITSDASGTIH